jgi:membrane protease YdiL (CAAX protease family)
MSPTLWSRAARWRFLVILLLLGALGVAAVTLQALPQMLSGRPLPLPLAVLQAISAAQSIVLLVMAVYAGWVWAPRVGLSAPLLAHAVWREEPLPPWRPLLTPGLLGGVAVAALLALASTLTPSALSGAALPEAMKAGMPPLARLLYGGLTEEILLRWGFMSLVAGSAWVWVQRRQGALRVGLMWASVVLSALAFALGHLPAAHTMVGHLDAYTVAYVLFFNSAAGVIFGWLYWRKGLEAAMLAHLTAHGLAILAQQVV